MPFEEGYGEDQCKRCGCTVSTRYGEEYTEVCDHCAQEIVIEVVNLYRRLGVMVTHLGGGSPLAEAYSEAIQACKTQLREVLKINDTKRQD